MGLPCRCISTPRPRNPLARTRARHGSAGRLPLSVRLSVARGITEVSMSASFASHLRNIFLALSNGSANVPNYYQPRLNSLTFCLSILTDDCSNLWSFDTGSLFCSAPRPYPLPPGHFKGPYPSPSFPSSSHLGTPLSPSTSAVTVV